MNFRRVLITGGAGFLGSSIALLLREAFPDAQISAFDNLKRRGSELNVPRLKQHSVTFIHGDVRCEEDIAVVPDFDLLIECAAEPSVQAGLTGGALPVISANTMGTVNCLEAARRCGAAFLFVSTSRVYPIPLLNGLQFVEKPTRFQWENAQAMEGFSPNGISESFPLVGGPRSIYGATKFASELFIQEYAYSYKMPALIDRCGILAGPWQMGKIDQGVLTLWVASHLFEKPLSYCGFGGTGKQVRDMLHVRDFFDLLLLQLRQPSLWDGRVYNVGGGWDGAVSLAELTALCQSAAGRKISLGANPQTSPVDLRIYVTDSSLVKRTFGWQPRRRPPEIVADVHRWLCDHREQLQTVFS